MRRFLRIRPVSALALAVGALWWWAVLRLAFAPADAGPVEGAVAVGGWGLGLLPVHCAPGPVRRRARRADTADAEAAAAATTRASTLHRSGEESVRS
ncbi:MULTISPECIES: hypothetical protein [unclassified Streptomyces]|uniref:hypothetical protein n=1 Tax=unclassified Streptomyces TaxID=2593676 RepID=UPI002258C447|nr:MULTISPECIES: hypothetical protein [unclassified Streptomyces]MCX4528470.1 hypothetical protein [Streptomyces sp. NBC_01551]MCX4540932.1 hypothetical protein [Streptomyces sp. NBC_01565]